MSKMLKKVMHYVKMPVVKYGVPAGAAGLCFLKFGLIHPLTLGIVVLGVVGNVLLHKKG